MNSAFRPNLGNYERPNYVALNLRDLENQQATALWVNRLTVGRTPRWRHKYRRQPLSGGARGHQITAINRHCHHATQQL
jgi:hypothetical protein